MPNVEKSHPRLIAFIGVGNSKYSRRLEKVLGAELDGRGFTLKKRNILKNKIDDSTEFPYGTTAMIIGEKVDIPQATLTDLPTIVLGSDNTGESAVNFLNKGAIDYIKLDDNPQRTGEYVAFRMDSILERRRQELIKPHLVKLGTMSLSTLSRELSTPTGLFKLRVNESFILQRLFSDPDHLLTLEDVQDFNKRKLTPGAFYHYSNRLCDYLQGSGYALVNKHAQGYKLTRES